MIRASLRTKLAGAMMATALVPLVIAAAVAHEVTLTRLELSLEIRARKNAQIALNLLLQHVQRVRDEVEAFARAPDLIELLTLQPSLVPALVRERARVMTPAVVEVADRRGKTVARANAPGANAPPEKTFHGGLALLKALNFERYITLAQVGKDVVIRAAVPVVDNEFSLRGVVISTVALDDDLAGYFKGVLRAEVAFVANNRMVGTTFLQRGRTMGRAELLTQITKALGADHPVLSLGGDDDGEFVVAAIPLQSAAGERVGSIVVGLDRDEFITARRGAQRALLFAFIVALFVALAGATMFGGHITVPLSRLHRGILAMAKGDRSHPLDIDTADEIGELARSFHDMRLALDEHERRLADRISELSTLHHVGRTLGSVLELDAVLRIVVTELSKVLRVERCALLTLREKDGELLLRAHAGLGGEEGPPALPPTWLALAAAAIAEHGICVDGRHLAVQLETRDKALGALVLARAADLPEFSEAAMHLAETFAGQAAAAIENAGLYQAVRRFSEGLEREVEKRTAELRLANVELERTLSELKETQTQLILSERLAGLGSLVAGVAHEVNTPSGAIQGSVQILPETLNRTLVLGARLAEQLSADEMRRMLATLSEARPRLAKHGVRPPAEVRRQAARLQRDLSALGIKSAKRLAQKLVACGAEYLAPFVVELADRSDPNDVVALIENLAFLSRGIGAIETANKRIIRLVKALRAYSHADPDALVEVEVTDGIETTLTILHTQLRGVSLVRKYREVPKILVYVDELNQVWTNLLHNAIQALEGEGTITIETFVDGDEVGVNITDNGPGIPSDVLPRIFEPHFSTKPRGEGTGLGLGIARKIVEKHGGMIAVESRPGHTSFTVHLTVAGPRRDEATSERERV
ncbi:MAG: HAMP domain-containing protein [Deltaproteobacteria bacterium]|nr:HAMP domain-containing protein [Deltaproteobacteria bacterium]